MSWRHLYPVLLVAFPPLALAAHRPTYVGAGDALRVALAVAVTAAVLMAGVYVLLRLRFPASRAAGAAAASALAAVTAFYAYRPAQVAARLTGAPPVLVVVAAGTAVGLAAWAVATVAPRRGLGPHAVEAYLTVLGAVMTVWMAGQIGVHEAAGALAVRRSALVRELARPVRTRAGAAAPAAARDRDVYVVVLDEYAGAAVLRERFGYDNTPFEDSLRALGFRVPAVVRSNYPITLLSVPSLLNFAQLRPFADEVDHDFQVSTPIRHVIDHNRAARFLKGRGYRYVFFGSSWFAATLGSDEADVRFGADPDAGTAGALYASDFRRYFVPRTSLWLLAGRFRSPAEVDAAHAARTFAGLRAVAGGARPTFAFAHVLLPHPPWVVDSACRPLRSGSRPTDGWDGSAAAGTMYVAQVRCVNAQVLATVRAILARPGPRPVIVLQGDHGSESLNRAPRDGVLPTAEQNAERYRAFGAYYLPDGGGAALPDTVSVVNVLRYVFAEYFGADLPPVPDAMYYAYWRPYDMRAVDPDFRVRPGPGGGGR